MYALLLTAVIAAHEPAAAAVPSSTPVASPAAAQPHPSPGVIQRFALTEPQTVSPLETSALADVIPMGNELSDLYHRYHADSRWRGGIGFSVSLIGQHRRWSFTIGLIQFRFDGQRHHSTPP